ncbi:MAG: hypothetical protein LBE79_02330 [Tannerella sp.]|nr:hypothetical protein [Tannerella sp.]
MKKTTLLTTIAALLLLAASCGQRQITPQPLPFDEIPGEAGYMGNIVEAYKYTDKTGENIVLLTETEVRDVTINPNNPVLYKGLYAFRFLKKDDRWEEVWRVYHYQDDCSHYPVAEFIKGAFTLTDLNIDSEAEVWMAYKASCKGGIDPDWLYVTMETGNRQYNVYGVCRLKFPDGSSMGGEYNFDDNFMDVNTPRIYRDYASKMWDKHVECGSSGGANRANTMPAAQPVVVEPMMTLTTNNNVISLGLQGTGTATIDWKDGSENETAEISEYTGFMREYPDTELRTMTISGKHITEFGCIWAGITELDVSKVTTLTTLSLKVNQLTSLDLSKNTVLAYIDIKANQFTASALNDLFGTLHGNGGTINIAYNPGTDDCDKSIAEAKGWTVEVVEPEEDNE